MKVVAVKQEGSHPVSEGYLSGFARVHPLGSERDFVSIVKSGPDIVLLDASVPALDTKRLLELLRNSKHPPFVMIFEFKQPPNQIKQQFLRLASLRTPASRRYSVSDLIRILGVSQEELARVLNVSARTIHRWSKRSPRRAKPELQQLGKVVAVLESVLSNPNAIRSYLRHRNPLLAGETPLVLLGRGEFERIANDLNALAEGVYI